MGIIDQQMVWRQFSAAISSFEDAVRGCPAELWEERLWEDQPDQWVAAGFSAFWYLSYHTLFWLDLYLTGFRNIHIIGWLFLFQSWHTPKSSMWSSMDVCLEASTQRPPLRTTQTPQWDGRPQ